MRSLMLSRAIAVKAMNIMLLAAVLMVVASPPSMAQSPTPPAITDLPTFVTSTRTDVLSNLWVVMGGFVGVYTIVWGLNFGIRKFRSIR